MKRNSIQATAFIWHVGLFILLAAGCQSRDSTMEVSVVVDFGPAGRSELQKPVAVSERSTVFDALRAAFPVVTSGR
jgi:hypothetical protein